MIVESYTYYAVILIRANNRTRPFNEKATMQVT